jgi:UDP-glucose:(heptosyl)LPS alpha-1,3-glucosyltransferase
MKIGIVLRTCKNTGSSKYIVETSEHFVKNNELHIFTNDWDTLDSRIVIHKIPTLSSNFYVWEASFMVISTLVTKFYKFDVTLAQPTRYFSPSIVEMQFFHRSWNDYRDKNHIPVSIGDRFLPLIEKYNVRKAKQVIAISESIKNDVLHHCHISEDRINIVYNGVNAKDFTPENRSKYFDKIRERHKITKDEIVLVFAGNPFVRKGLRYTIEALPKLKIKNYKLLIVGGDDPNKQPHVDIIHKLGLDDKVIWIGITPEINKYFAASDIFVLPTIYDPFGIVIVEAMASGLPVVTSKLAGAAELINHGEDGLHIKNPTDSDEIAENLNYLIQSDNTRKEMGKEARKKAENYTWERTAKQMLEVFEKAAKS